MRSARLGFLFLSVILAAACTSDVEPLTPAQREVVAAYVGEESPSPQWLLDATLGQRVKLLGYDLDRARWRPGETMRVTWHWQVLRPLDKGAALFTQIEDRKSGRVLHQDGNGTLRWLYGADHWRAGQFVRDVQDLHLPEDWAGDSATIYVGIAREGLRLPVVGETSHANDRVLAVTVPTPNAANAERDRGSVPRVAVVQTEDPPRLDGSLLDPVWSAAPATAAFVETRKGGPAEFRAFAKLLWDERYLYLGVEVHDALLRASETEQDAHLWEQDCVELMIDPDGDGRGYFEIQVSPRGAVFDTRYDARRIPKPFGHVDWNSESRVSVSARGTIDDRHADAGYTVELAIPWQAFSLDEQRSAGPTIGDEWRANLYVMDLMREDQRAAAWSPLGIGDFHVPQRFGILSFEGPPEDMQGTNEPSIIPPGRVPGSLERRSGFDPDVKDKLIQQRETRRRLESSGGGH
jgi:hypothetical protein